MGPIAARGIRPRCHVASAAKRLTRDPDAGAAGGRCTACCTSTTAASTDPRRHGGVRLAGRRRAAFGDEPVHRIAQVRGARKLQAPLLPGAYPTMVSGGGGGRARTAAPCALGSPAASASGAGLWRRRHDPRPTTARASSMGGGGPASDGQTAWACKTQARRCTVAMPFCTSPEPYPGSRGDGRLPLAQQGLCRRWRSRPFARALSCIASQAKQERFLPRIRRSAGNGLDACNWVCSLSEFQGSLSGWSCNSTHPVQRVD